MPSELPPVLSFLSHLNNFYNSFDPTRHFAEVSSYHRNVFTNNSIQNSAELNSTSNDGILLRIDEGVLRTIQLRMD